MFNCVGLIFYLMDYCNGLGGICNDVGIVGCNDFNVCTNDSCLGFSGCFNVNNFYFMSCYIGQSGMVDVGDCYVGIKICVNGVFGGCVGQVILQVNEVCDLILVNDEDCDGLFNEQGVIGCMIYYKDMDQDGYGLFNDSWCLCVVSFFYMIIMIYDCNDGDVVVNFGVIELCNGIDDDCDNVIDEEDVIGCMVYYKDVDNDGYGQMVDVRCLCAVIDPYDVMFSGDCVDSNNVIYFNQIEFCDNVDNDCEGGIDEDYIDLGDVCIKGSGICVNSGIMVCNLVQMVTYCSVMGKVVGVVCVDSNNCMYIDVCFGGDIFSCLGMVYFCNDSKVCMIDFCVNDNLVSCSNIINLGKCLIGGICYNDGNWQGLLGYNVCKYCSFSFSQIVWINVLSMFVCNGLICLWLIFYFMDYCGNGMGICLNFGIMNCSGINFCKFYGCNNLLGCMVSNLGNGIKCGGEVCLGDIWYYIDKCENGICKDGSVKNCIDDMNSCRNGYCFVGCKIINYSLGIKCGGEDCLGQKYNKKDICNGLGICNDGGQMNCNFVDNQCCDGYCIMSGCSVNDYVNIINCMYGGGYSNQCSGQIWYYQDKCDGLGICINKGFKDCNIFDIICVDYYCQGGCFNYILVFFSIVCIVVFCVGGCMQNNVIYCNGLGFCNSGGGQISCGGNCCFGIVCISVCFGNGECCDISGDN